MQEIFARLGLRGTVINAVARVLIYRQYLPLASESIEFDAMVVESTEEMEDGKIQVDPLALAAILMDHISQFSGLLKWIRF